MPFAPEECLQALKAMYNTYCTGGETRLWGPYGFRDAFNPTKNWFGTDYIGIDQGPIVLMIENYLTQRVWETFMKSPYIQTGLQRAGFTKVTGVNGMPAAPRRFGLQQNFPNPFNPSTTIVFDLPSEGRVRLTVTDLLGKEVAMLADERRPAGTHEVRFDAASLSLPSGVYFYTLAAGGSVQSRKMVLTK